MWKNDPSFVWYKVHLFSAAFIWLRQGKCEMFWSYSTLKLMPCRAFKWNLFNPLGNVWLEPTSWLRLFFHNLRGKIFMLREVQLPAQTLLFFTSEILGLPLRLPVPHNTCPKRKFNQRFPALHTLRIQAVFWISFSSETYILWAFQNFGFMILDAKTHSVMWNTQTCV